jgi:hypothetical protein
MLELPISLFIQQAWNELPDSIAIWSYYHGASYWTIVSKLCSINHIQTSFVEVLAIGSYSKVLLFLFLHFPAGNLHRGSIFSSDCIPHRHVPDILWTPPFLDDVQTPPAFSRKQTQFWLKRPRDFDSAQNSLPETKRGVRR